MDPLLKRAKLVLTEWSHFHVLAALLVLFEAALGVVIVQRVKCKLDNHFDLRQDSSGREL
jgi:hypothetical protein